MKDPASQLRSATRRAKSDVANKLVSMFLHELSRKISQKWPIKVDGEEYVELVRKLLVVSMGQRNTSSKSACRSLTS